jgi:hypothetical protein
LHRLTARRDLNQRLLLVEEVHPPDTPLQLQTLLPGAAGIVGLQENRPPCG